MTNFQESFHESVKEYLLKKEGIERVYSIVSVKEETYSSGGCETCWFEEQIVRVVYIDDDLDECTHTIWGTTFSELLQALVAGWPE